MNINCGQYNGWSIAHGDYLRVEDDHSKKHKDFLKRKKIASRLGIIFSAVSVFILFVIVLNIISRF